MPATPDRAAEAAATQNSADLAQALHWLMPLHFFYEQAGIPLPDFQFLSGKAVPYPYRSLLVHENDMTPTLAAFHHSKLYLEVHEKVLTDDYLMRMVTLHAAASDVPVEFGAIGIHLGSLPSDTREAVVDGRIPLGAILGEHGVPHHGSPAAFFSVPADQLMIRTLRQIEGTTLFGRCNQLVDDDGIAIADIVEILPRSDESERWIGGVNKIN
ncbi:MAG: hypothetical protein KDN19_10275 [Verrucomicrobiae bacterium]|nr:hypothetical protein [Verrucomicrobiae bacterium]